MLACVFNVAYERFGSANPLSPLLPGVICLIPKPGKAGNALTL